MKLMEKWYVVATKSGCESMAEHHLRNQRFEVFLPRHKRIIRHARRAFERKAPLFPGYLFARFNPETIRWRAINGTVGVKSLVGRGEQPSPLPLGFVEALLSATAADGTLDYAPALTLGDRVEVISGPFARQVGELCMLDERGRVAVLLDMLSMAVPVRTTLDNLMRA